MFLTNANLIRENSEKHKQTDRQTDFSSPRGKLTSHLNVSPLNEVKYIYSPNSNYD